MSEFYGPEESARYRAAATGAVELSEAESKALAEKMAALDKMLREQVRAKYKIEVEFGKGRSALAHKHFPGIMSIYLSGTKLNGGGDEKVYMCPTPNCKGLIDPKHRLEGVVVCMKCERKHKEDDLIGEKLFRLTPPNWAQAILNHFIVCDHNADIYLKYHPTDVRYQTMMELARNRGGEEIGKARRNRGLHIYPLKNIINDTKHGADLYKRILTFITV